MNEYKIIVDSSCELPEKILKDGVIEQVPFRLEINGVPVRDNSSINTKTLIEKIVEAKAFTRLACPSPDTLCRHIAEGDEKRVYLITISSKISSCYVSALMAKKMYEEKNDDKEIYVIDSKSISGGESQLALKIMELEEQGICGEELKKQIIGLRDELKTVMIMKDIETAYNDIMVPKFKELIDTANNINIKENFDQIVDSMAVALKNASEQTRVIITHCNNLIDAEKLRDIIVEKTGLCNIEIMGTSGINSVLTSLGGLIVTY